MTVSGQWLVKLRIKSLVSVGHYPPLEGAGGGT